MHREAAATWRWGEDPAILRRLVERGGVLVLPTESSYALAADPCNQKGVEAVFRIKRRAADQPLPVVVDSLAMISSLGLELPAGGLGGLERAWPGGLSILLRCTREIPAAAGSQCLAVRVPGHGRLVALLSEIGFALTATSANRSGSPPLLEAAATRGLIDGEDAMIVDDGTLPGGPPSTLVALGQTGLTILRQGRVEKDRLMRIAPQWFSAASVEIPVEELR